MRFAWCQRRFCLLVVSVALACPLFGCGAAAGRPAAGDAESAFPLWQGRERQLFDDVVDPAALGLSMEGVSAAGDPLLRERAQTADVVAQVRVSTVTVDTVGEDSTYHLSVQVGHPPLRTPKLDDATLDLSIRPGSRSHPLAKALDTRLRGMTFVCFARRYADAEGGSELHWHLAPDSQDVVAAVKEAVALGELAGH